MKISIFSGIFLALLDGKIGIFKEENIKKETSEDESLPEDDEISLEELKDQEKIKEGSDELVDPKSSDNA